MSKSTTTTTANTQTTMLPAGQQGNVDTLMGGLKDWYTSGGPKYYSGPTVAQPNADVLAGRQAQLTAANGVGGLLSTAQQGDQFWLNPQNTFNPANIPGFDAAQHSVVQGATRNLTENILPSIRMGSVQSGTYGGSRQGIGEGLAVGRTNDALAGQLAQMQMEAFDRGLQQYNAAQNRLPQTLNDSMMPGQVQQQVGMQAQQDTQKNYDATKQQYDFNQMAPLFALQQLQQLTGGSGTYGGTVMANSTGGQNVPINPLQVLGGVTAAAGAAGSLGWKPFQPTPVQPAVQP